MSGQPLPPHSSSLSPGGGPTPLWHTPAECLAFFRRATSHSQRRRTSAAPPRDVAAFKAAARANNDTNISLNSLPTLLGPSAAVQDGCGGVEIASPTPKQRLLDAADAPRDSNHSDEWIAPPQQAATKRPPSSAVSSSASGRSSSTTSSFSEEEEESASELVDRRSGLGAHVGGVLGPTVLYAVSFKLVALQELLSIEQSHRRALERHATSRLQIDAAKCHAMASRWQRHGMRHRQRLVNLVGEEVSLREGLINDERRATAVLELWHVNYLRLKRQGDAHLLSAAHRARKAAAVSAYLQSRFHADADAAALQLRDELLAELPQQITTRPWRYVSTPPVDDGASGVDLTASRCPLESWRGDRPAGGKKPSASRRPQSAVPSIDSRRVSIRVGGRPMPRTSFAQKNDRDVSDAFRPKKRCGDTPMGPSLSGATSPCTGETDPPPPEAEWVGLCLTSTAVRSLPQPTTPTQRPRAQAPSTIARYRALAQRSLATKGGEPNATATVDVHAIQARWREWRSLHDEDADATNADTSGGGHDGPAVDWCLHEADLYRPRDDDGDDDDD